MFGQDRIGVDVRQHGEALLHQDFRRPQGADRVGQQVAGIRDHLEFHEGVLLLAGQLGQLPAEAGHPHRLLRGGTAGGIGQHPDALPIDRFEQAFVAGGLALHPAYGDRDDLAATGHQAGLHGRQAGVLAGTGHQAAAEAATADHQARVLGGTGDGAAWKGVGAMGHSARGFLQGWTTDNSRIGAWLEGTAWPLSLPDLPLAWEQLLVEL